MNMTSASLFDATQMGKIRLPNRVLMAPLTRNRAMGDGTPKEMTQTYYAQRASSGLIVSEATQISPMGKGYFDTPGIYEDSHVASWRRITDAVHAAGGRIVCQLWHVGRISHTSLLPEGRVPVAPSAIRAEAQIFNEDGPQDCSEPIALDADGVAQVVREYRHAAQCARDAGFDGVEVHAANGYLLDQFLQDGSNQRDDQYGGSFENRARLLTNVLDAVTEVWSADQVGVRLSPLGQFNAISDGDPEALFGYVYERLSERGMAYLHVIEAFPELPFEEGSAALMARLRERFTGFYIGNGGYDAEKAKAAILSGHADAIAFGRPFISNPDLPERLRVGAELNAPDGDTFYGGDEKGYTDYAFLEQSLGSVGRRSNTHDHPFNTALENER